MSPGRKSLSMASQAIPGSSTGLSALLMLSLVPIRKSWSGEKLSSRRFVMHSCKSRTDFYGSIFQTWPLRSKFFR